MGLILVAVDGTGSRAFLEGTPDRTVQGKWTTHTIPGDPAADKTDTQLWRSHVRNFYDDYATDDMKAYRHGPDTGFPTTVGAAQSASIHRGAFKWVCEQWCKNGCEGPIDLVGFSRGGYIVLNIAERLKNEGCECNGTTTKDIPVRFLGMYDPVDSAPGYGWTDTISSNVQHSYVARAVGRREYIRYKIGINMFVTTVVQSRWSFNRKGHTADSNATNLTVDPYEATHGGIGGGPWDGDHPRGHTEKNDIDQAIAVDKKMRDAAQGAGVDIP